MRKNRLSRLFIDIFGLIIIAILILPPLVTLAGSFMSKVELDFYYFGADRVESFRFVPDRFTLAQYADALIFNTDFTRAFLNSIEYTLLSTFFSMLISIPAAYCLAFGKFGFKRVIAVVYLLLMVLPYQSIEIPHYLMLRETGLLGHDIAVIITNIFDTFETVVITFFFSSIPSETLEAADIDGAGSLKKLIYIAAPQIKPGILTVMLLKFINIWNLTEQPLIFLDDPTHYPLSLMLPGLCGSFRFDSFAFSIVFILPPVLMYFGLSDQIDDLSGQYKPMG